MVLLLRPCHQRLMAALPLHNFPQMGHVAGQILPNKLTVWRLAATVYSRCETKARQSPTNGCHNARRTHRRQLLAPHGKSPFAVELDRRTDELAGREVITADLPWGRLGMSVCYDLRFPEPFRPAASNTDLYCVIANWPARARSPAATRRSSTATASRCRSRGQPSGPGVAHARREGCSSAHPTAVPAAPRLDSFGPLDQVPRVRGDDLQQGKAP